jgi:hypothetical protein
VAGRLKAGGLRVRVKVIKRVKVKGRSGVRPSGRSRTSYPTKISLVSYRLDRRRFFSIRAPIMPAPPLARGGRLVGI